jgi:hypothetical protein
MRAIAFLSALETGFLTSGMILPAILLWSHYAIAQVIPERLSCSLLRVGYARTHRIGISR